MNIINLAENYSVGPKMSLNDLQSLADSGFTDIVCNLPDAEMPAGPLSAEVSSRAKKLGLNYHYLPISQANDFGRQANAIRSIIQTPRSRTFAYCRSGGRAAKAFELAA